MTHTSIKFDPITVDEASSLSRLDPRTVREKAKERKFRARKPTRHWQIDRISFLDWLESTEALV